MYPISAVKGKDAAGISFSEFTQAFLDICAEHRKECRALAFAFILYDERYPEMRHMLNDSYYWEALDRIAGDRLTVFTFMLPRPRKKAAGSHMLEMMLRVSSDSLEPAREFLAKLFNEDIMVRLPGIVFFQVDEDNVSNLSLVTFKSSSKEAVFAELREVLQTVADSISKVKMQYRYNSSEIWALVEEELVRRKIIRIIRAIPVLQLAKFIKGLEG